MFSKNYGKRIRGYIYKKRKVEKIKQINKPTFQLGQKLSSLKQKDLNEIKNHIDLQLKEWTYVEKKQIKKPKYCIDKQLITKKEKKRFEERNEIIRLYNQGMTFEDMLDYFGRKRKIYIKRVILEESFEPEDAPGIIPNYRNAKLKIAQKNYIDQLVGNENYLGGLRDTTERLIYHDNENIQVKVTEATVRKYLNKDYS